MENSKTWVVEDSLGLRLDKFICLQMPEVSRSQLQTWLQEGHVRVNNVVVKANYKVKKGDFVLATIPQNKEIDVAPENIPLSIVYEDDSVIVVDKPSGMIVHPTPATTSKTLVNALLYHCQDLSGINGYYRPGIVHRIDKETSGLLMVAKNDVAHQSLSKQLQDHTVVRKYEALVHGNFTHTYGKINAPIGRDENDRQKMAVRKEGKEAITNFTVEKQYPSMSFITCRLETGRTHQIRVHLSYIDHPVYGDPKYGRRKDPQDHGQYLHASTLGFIHPVTKEYMEFESPLPDFFQDKLQQLEMELGHGQGD